METYFNKRIIVFQVTSQGQVIGAIVAVDQATAQKAARSVIVEYEDIQPIIISIEVNNNKIRNARYMYLIFKYFFFYICITECACIILNFLIFP